MNIEENDWFGYQGRMKKPTVFWLRRRYSSVYYDGDDPIIFLSRVRRPHGPPHQTSLEHIFLLTLYLTVRRGLKSVPRVPGTYEKSITIKYTAAGIRTTRVSTIGFLRFMGLAHKP